MIKKTFRSISIILLIIAVFFASPAVNFNRSQTVRASGDLTVVWGVPEGDPIFVVNNIAPGEDEERTVQVTNDASSPRPVGIKALKQSGALNLESVLDVVISQGATDLYGGTSPTGPKTLLDFFNESASLEFIELSTLAAGATTSYKIKVTFKSSAGNEFQNSSVIFDLSIGVGFDLPAECNYLSPTVTPIFGTSGNDTIHGTNKSDLIITFEGKDKVFGKSGDDCIVGGEGDDELRGETGKDVILGEGGNDLVVGATGVDFVSGGEGDDDVRGETGDDKLFGDSGNDQMTGGAGDDVMNGGLGDDVMDGEAGKDTLSGNENNDKLKGGTGNDNLTGNAGTDNANGETGKDSCDAETETLCEL